MARRRPSKRLQQQLARPRQELSLPLFGIFFGVIVVTEDERAYRRTGSRIRVVCGALALGAIAILWAAPMEVITFSVIVGAMLGYAGKYWVRCF